jgi:hypothetical protein
MYALRLGNDRFQFGEEFIEIDNGLQGCRAETG